MTLQFKELFNFGPYCDVTDTHDNPKFAHNYIKHY